MAEQTRVGESSISHFVPRTIPQSVLESENHASFGPDYEVDGVFHTYSIFSNYQKFNFPVGEHCSKDSLEWPAIWSYSIDNSNFCMNDDEVIGFSPFTKAETAEYMSGHKVNVKFSSIRRKGDANSRAARELGENWEQVHNVLMLEFSREDEDFVFYRFVISNKHSGYYFYTCKFETRDIEIRVLV